MTADPRFRFLERVSLPAPLGLVFWDFATGTPVRDGLSVSVAPRDRPHTARQLIVNRNAVWLAPTLPGLSAGQLATGDWTALRRTYRVEVSDSFGRFLPLAFEAELPSRGLYQWPGWTASPPMALLPLLLGDSPAGVSPPRIPLFSSAARSAPPGVAEVRCQLADAATREPAARALVVVSHAGVARGIGLADDEGRAAVFFAYPDRPRPTLATSPPAITDFRWALEVDAFYHPLPNSGAGVPTLAAVPTLADVVAQLDHVREPLDSILSPPEVLPSQLLTFGRPLILRTSRTPSGRSSVLFLGPD